jgi:hypothetical protein
MNGGNECARKRRLRKTFDSGASGVPLLGPERTVIAKDRSKTIRKKGSEELAYGRTGIVQSELLMFLVVSMSVKKRWA